MDAVTPARRAAGETEPATLFCVARGHQGEWEAFCLDLDLAVLGQSFEEVRSLLQEAVSTYILDAGAETEPARSELLSRRVPFHVRLWWAMQFFKAAVFPRRRDRDSTIWLPITCRA
jgi:hypothetical protein